MSIITKTFVLALFTLAHCMDAVYAQACIGSFDALRALEVARGNNNAVPVTYVICPNTVFNISAVPPEVYYWEMNGNTNYLCGENGSLANNCTVTGGETQAVIVYSPFDSSSKENILVQGFTFEKASITNVAIASEGKHTFRDCIFRDSATHAVFIFVLYIPPTLRRRTRMLAGEDKFDYKQDFVNFMKDPELQKSRERDMASGRSLLIGGGSEPRETLLFDGVQFLNNSLIPEIVFPSLAANGPFRILTQFSDVTMTNCLFKDNYYPFSREISSGGFGIKIASSSTLNISNTCFVNEYYEGNAPVWIVADSGLVSSKNNYVSETPVDPDFGEPISPCQYLFKEEAYRCIAPESNVCNHPVCAASYKLFNARTDTAVANIVNGGTITSPPCSVNIQVVLPCATEGKSVNIQLLNSAGRVIRSRTQTDSFFLFGIRNNDVLSGTIAAGTYTIQAVANGTVVQPSPTKFTLSGRCI